MNKIEEKDLAQIKGNKEKRDKIVIRIGELELQKSRLLDLAKQTDDEARDLSITLAKKYGEVNIDLNTGNITPIEKK